MRLSFLWTHRRLEQNATLPAWASVQVRDIPSDDDAHKPITPPLRQSTTSKSPLRKDRFPEIASATAAVIPKDTVLDGEVVVWNGARLDFELLQQRLAGGAARIARQVREHPASYVVFDVLAINGEDLRNRPLRERRATLENMAKQWAPPLQLSPLTDDITTAQAWLTDYRQAGIEGLVIKGAGTRYEPNQHRWIKVKARESIEVIMGAVIGPIDRPESIVAGLYRNGTLVIAGSSVPLTTVQPVPWQNC